MGREDFFENFEDRLKNLWELRLYTKSFLKQVSREKAFFFVFSHF
jgi:hypothetical protein